MLLFYNEKLNCTKMLELFPDFPFHAVLEIAGLAIFYFICKFFTSF
jgi:sulfur relay (sulfurtransferase) DsrC/TusE family protein